MALNLAPQTRRAETLALGACVLLALILLALPLHERVRIAEFLHTLLVAPFDATSDFIEDVAGVRAENARLEAELTALRLDRGAVVRLRRERDVLREQLGLRIQSPAQLVPCEVRRRRVAPDAVLIQIRSAEPLDWQRYQAVVARGGLVGRIHTITGPRTAWVELLSSPGTAVSCELERTGLPGILRTRDGETFDLDLIGRDEDVRHDDLVVTSDLGIVLGADGRGTGGLPRGIPVGRVVSELAPADQIFKTIVVRPFVDADRLEVVFVVIGLGDWFEPVDGGPDREETP